RDRRGGGRVRLPPRAVPHGFAERHRRCRPGRGHPLRAASDKPVRVAGRGRALPGAAPSLAGLLKRSLFKAALFQGGPFSRRPFFKAALTGNAPSGRRLHGGFIVAGLFAVRRKTAGGNAAPGGGRRTGGAARLSIASLVVLVFAAAVVADAAPE